VKIGQKVWYIDHISMELVEGTLVSPENQSRYDEHPTLLVKVQKYGVSMNERILEDWVFSSEAKAKQGLKEFIQQKLKELKTQERQLRQKLQNL
jgi:hypothetical protein